MAGSPRFTQKLTADRQGVRRGVSLPYHLQPDDLFRTVEDLYALLHDVNGLLDSKGYDRLEELLDPAGFSGFLSRSTVDRLDRLSRALVQNRHHNGFPDLLPKGAYAGDAVQHGRQGGLEVKASRYPSSWQAHGPRSGWFCVVQFEVDEDTSKALQDREPTMIRAVMVADLDSSDWSWQPAAAGRIRSGTASVLPSGRFKLRSGAVWVDPAYEAEHHTRLANEKRSVFGLRADAAVLAVLQAVRGPMSTDEVTAAIAGSEGFTPQEIRSVVYSRLRALVKAGQVQQPARGRYQG